MVYDADDARPTGGDRVPNEMPSAQDVAHAVVVLRYGDAPPFAAELVDLPPQEGEPFASS